MPLEKKQCTCGDTKIVCPDCGSHSVTPREDMYTPSPNDVVDYGVEGLNYDALNDGDTAVETVEYQHVCWTCGWTEDVKIEVTRGTIA